MIINIEWPLARRILDNDFDQNKNFEREKYFEFDSTHFCLFNDHVLRCILIFENDYSVRTSCCDHSVWSDFNHINRMIIQKCVVKSFDELLTEDLITLTVLIWSCFQWHFKVWQNTTCQLINLNVNEIRVLMSNSAFVYFSWTCDKVFIIIIIVEW